ncbi:DUF3307 domain-containing protein [bacterium]|nr:MAG: DUF3307 domain-containing protein [bacterium]
MNIELFIFAFLAHLVGDYLIQTEYEASNKPKGSFFNWALLIHVVKYTVCVGLAIAWCGASYWWIVWIFATHYVLDRRAFIIWWRRKIMRSSEKSIKNDWWLNVIVDQIFHILTIAVIAILS